MWAFDGLGLGALRAFEGFGLGGLCRPNVAMTLGARMSLHPHHHGLTQVRNDDLGSWNHEKRTWTHE